MATIHASTFPGVYSKVTDQSFVTETTSRYHPGLIGVAEKGPFDVPTAVRSKRDYLKTFGKSIPNRYMAHYGAVLGDLSDGLTVVRVGNRYKTVATGGSGEAGSHTVHVGSKAVLFSVNEFVRVSQPGKKTSVNMQIAQISGGNLLLSTQDAALADTYHGAVVDSAEVSGAANEAEAFLDTYTYDSPITSLGTIVGRKNEYKLTVTADASAALHVGDLIKIEQEGRITTSEIRVKDVGPLVSGLATITFDTSNDAEYGYQAVALQDSYLDPSLYDNAIPAATISKVAKNADGSPVTRTAIPLIASSAGEWANSDGVKTGLVVQVSPGSKPGTKKLLVYENSGLVETIDNLSLVQSDDNFYNKRIQGSSYIAIPAGYTVAVHPANTVNPWNTAVATTVNFAAFNGGFNGDSPSIQDFIGTINPADDSPTGLQCFDDENLDVDAIAAPDVPELFAENDVAILQEIARVGRKVYANGFADIPRGLNARNAIDYHNGAGFYASRGRIDNYSLSTCWNWIQIADSYNGNLVWVPPSLGFMRCQAATFDGFKPWFAAAGEVRGIIPEALAVEFERVSSDTKSAMYGDGNSVNPILLQRGRIMVYGDRTMQRAESKLTATHSVCLTNNMLKNMGLIARKFVFDPNDPTLLSSLNLSMTAFLETVKDGRGVEEYLLVLDTTNNTADTRNKREVIVDFSYIPVDAAERIYINATVRESGATLNKIV